MKIDGIDELLNQLDDMHNDIDDDVEKIVKKNALKFSSLAKSNAKAVMIKGFWTGNLASQIKAIKSGALAYTVHSNAYYSGFVEFGTRDMRAESYFLPTYKTISKEFKNDLDSLF